MRKHFIFSILIAYFSFGVILFDGCHKRVNSQNMSEEISIPDHILGNIDKAVEENNVELIKEYINSGGSVNVALFDLNSKQTSTMLWRAVDTINVPLVQYLLEKRANPYLSAENNDPKEITPRELAVLREGQYPFDVQKQEEIKEIIKLLEKAENEFMERQERLQSAMEKYDKNKVLQILQEGGVQKDSYHRCYMYFLKSCDSDGVGTILNYNDILFVPNEDDLNYIKHLDCSEMTKNCLSRIVYSCMQRDIYVFYKMRILSGEIQKKASSKEDQLGINDILPTGKTLLMYACETCNLRLIQLLLENGADPTIKDGVGNTAKDYACRGFDTGEKEEIIKLLTGNL